MSAPLFADIALLYVQSKKMVMYLSTPLKKYTGDNRGIAPLIVNHSTRWRPVVGITPRPLYPRVRTPCISWAPEPLWTFWRRGKPLVPAGIPLRTVLLLPVPLKTSASNFSLGRSVTWTTNFVVFLTPSHKCRKSSFTLPSASHLSLVYQNNCT